MHALTAENLGPILDELGRNAPRWTALPLTEQYRFLQQMRDATYRLAEHWAEVCCRIKGLDVHSATAGQEWGVGPMIVLRNLRLLQGRVGRPTQPSQGYRRTFPANLGD